jgi:hypothetical protein
MADEMSLEQQVREKSIAGGLLTQALLSLWGAERLCATCAANEDAVSGLIRDAVVLYGSAFEAGEGEGERRLSAACYVPISCTRLHRDLMAYRSRLFAYFVPGWGDPGRAAAEAGQSWQKEAKGALGFVEAIPGIKALILEIVSERLWPELLGEHHELAGDGSL